MPAGVGYGLGPAEAGLLTGAQFSGQALQRGTEVVDDIYGQALSNLPTAQAEAYNTIQGTYDLGVGAFDQGRSQIQQGLGGFINQGQGAGGRQAALSGAMGQQAQQQAYSQFQDSPGQQFLRERGERALLRNSAALGGLGGGNVRKGLVEFGQGMAAQDFQNQFDRLGQVANRGSQAAQTASGLYSNLAGQQAGFAQGLGSLAAGIPLDTAMAQGNLQAGRAGLQSGLYTQAANLGLRTGENLSNMRTQAGRDISGNIAGTSSALANFVNEQGQVMGDTYGQGAINVNNLIQAASSGDAAAQEQLSQLVSSQGVQGAGYAAGVPAQSGFQSDYLGQLGQLAGGVGGILQGYNAYQGGGSGGGTPFYDSYYQAAGQ